MAATPEIMVLLKPVRVRELRDGMWVAVAEDSEPLVVNEAIAKALCDPDAIEASSTLGPLTETLSDAGFTDSSADGLLRPPSAPVGAGGRAARAVLWALGAAFFTASAALLLLGGVPTGADAISVGPHSLLTITVAVGIAIITAVPHELAHVMFGRTFGRRRGSVRVKVRRASATTNLTHVWAWSSSPRLAAVSAGIVVDLAFLTLVLVLRTTTGAWVATVAATVMVMRIVWQLRFHRNCDGRHIAKMLIDNPTIDTDTKRALTARLWTSAPRSAWLWLAVVAACVLAELALFAVWLAPAALRLLGVL
ncbi:MAG TPA: hypothetical protein VFC82_10420 [Actinomycetaceae bacterium]|nr:hypothetical protein [Actinomycetaceae bacterium]